MTNSREKKYIASINDNRHGIMGFAVIWIVFFHSALIFDFPILTFLKAIGYGGVDIFFFLSGIGIYFSLKKNAEIVPFYKKRALRIIPLYIPAVIIFYFLIAFTMDWSYLSFIEFVQGLLGNLLFVGSFIGLKNQFLWFVSALMLFYMLSPCLFFIIKKINEKKIKLSLFIFILFLIQIPFLFNNYDLIMIVSRFPLYCFGMIAANSYFNQEKKYSNWILIVLMVIGLIVLGIIFLLPQDYRTLFFEQLGMSWYPFILITPGLCLILSVIFSFLKKQKITQYIYNLFEICGKRSLGICLIHILINYFIAHLGVKLINWQALLIVIVSILLGIFYDMFVNCIITQIQNRKNK